MLMHEMRDLMRFFLDHHLRMLLAPSSPQCPTIYPALMQRQCMTLAPAHSAYAVSSPAQARQELVEGFDRFAAPSREIADLR
mmetsp:Transcript_25738/g.70900  ORF Transcript_25738/g.70900 Transcript_25738/m.70900 type:complete len:82 (+) Transcript_25738:572-817(+)